MHKSRDFDKVKKEEEVTKIREKIVMERARGSGDQTRGGILCRCCLQETVLG